MRTMKTLVIQGAEKAEVAEVPIPEPGPGQVLVKVTAVTTCPQWDLHIYYGKPMFATDKEVPFPYTAGQPGHEMTGVVHRTGPGVGLQVGQTVSAWKDQGHNRPGCYAEYVIIDEHHLLPVPDGIPYRKVASLELAMCVAASVMQMKRMVGIAGKRCGVNGLGPAGLIALQMLRAEGASEVIGVDPNESRRQLAVRLGARHALHPQEDSESELLPRRRKANAANTLDLAIDCVGYPESVRFIMDRTHEAVALFAVQRDEYALFHQGLSVLGYPGHSREAAEYALQLIVDGKLDLSPLVSKELTLEQYGEGVRLLAAQQAIKIAFVFDDESR
ncbi:zinc-binding dehydrogenase [Paenibacillus sp. GYB004]|uniref:zinc-dependent alcohol dehydrogenase n=1 Tax=Paenibacillus sp. GYB004 TaxID=2994393 RepID=UPI002F96A140